MTKRLLLLITAVLSCIAAIAWMMTPEVPPANSIGLPETRPASAVASADDAARSISDRGDGTAGDGSKTVGHPDNEISEMAPSPAPVLQLPPTPSVSPGFTATPGTRFFAASPARAVPRAHIRVLPTILAPGTSTPSGGPVIPTTPSGTAPGTITLEVDAALHDPAVWAEEEEQEPVTPAQDSLKARIAGEFDAEVAAVVSDPATAKKRGLDQAWRDARARANQEYQMFFGADAANRAALSAGRASLSPP